jgi:hypothetical protein
MAKIKALGYSLEKKDSILCIQSLNRDEGWILKFDNERWILCVNDVPQIAFLPEEAVKFLGHRKFRKKAKHLPSASFGGAFA